MTNPTTPHFGLTYLTAGQLQPEVTLNGNMVLVDALSQPSTISITTTTPPSSPADGATYIIPTGATGAWASAAVGSLTVWSANNGAWSFYAPQTGWTVYNQSNNTFYAYNGTAWAATAGSSGGITALTGDVTASGTGSVTATIAANAVTNAKAAQMAANTLKGNNTGSTANAADLTVAQVSSLLALAPSATTDTTNASHISSGTLSPARMANAQTVGDAAATITAGKTAILLTAAITAARTYTLAAANSYPAGFAIPFADVVGTLTGTNTATLAAAGTDTINGAATLVLSTAYAEVWLVTDGTGKWTTDARIGAVWGSITGTLSSQTDLNTALNARPLTSSLAPGAIGTVQVLGDGDATIANGTATAIITTALTAARTYTLPAASSYAAGFRILLADITGSISNNAGIVASIAANGTDTIDGLASYVFSNAYAQAWLVSNGTNAWSLRHSGPRVQIDTFWASGTWVKQPWAVEVLPMLWGPGGAGGSGRRGAAGTVRCGGGGGSAGAFTSANMPALAVAATEIVTIGVSGTPGAPVATDNTNGQAGSVGSPTTFGAWLRAAAGNPGQGGTATSGSGGAAAAGTTTSPFGGNASTTGGVGGGGQNSAGNCSGAGGAGGGITSADSPSNGGPGGAANGITQVNPSGGTVPGGAGANGGTNAAAFASSGGGGGAASITGPAGSGGNGLGAGAGGGGGGASLNGNNSGGGGTPGPALCVVIQRG